MIAGTLTICQHFKESLPQLNALIDLSEKSKCVKTAVLNGSEFWSFKFLIEPFILRKVRHNQLNPK
jgi:hypothetical protein